MIDHIAAIIIGGALILSSRWIADNVRIPGEHDGSAGAMIRFAGLYDSDMSRLYRWATCVLAGLAFLGVGVAGLVS